MVWTVRRGVSRQLAGSRTRYQWLTYGSEISWVSRPREKASTVPVRAVVMLLLDNCKFDGAIQLEPSVLTRPLRGLIHSRPTAARAKSGCAGWRRMQTDITGEGDGEQDCEGNRTRVDRAELRTRGAHAQSAASCAARPCSRIARALCARMAAGELGNAARITIAARSV